MSRAFPRAASRSAPEARFASLRACLVALVVFCACSLDNAGLRSGSGGAGSVGAGGGGGGGTAGLPGVAGAGGAAGGLGGIAGAAGSGALAGAGGAAGGDTGGDAGNGTPPWIGGNGGDDALGGAGGSGGTSGSGGEAGASGGAGAGGDAGASGGAGGGGGVSGSGGGGAGSGGVGGSCGACPPCSRCANGVCSVDPMSLWKIRCISASIAQAMPGGGAWDLGLGNATAPDPQCAFWLGSSSAAQTSTLSNTFAPVWNESITPGSRFRASLLSSQSNPWSIQVTDEDDVGSDAICSVRPTLDAAAFASGTVTFANVGGCATLAIGLECVPQ